MNNLISSTKCHTGPGCRLHSATGITRVKRELATAQERILKATDLNEMFEAQQQLLQARKHYDITTDGRIALASEIEEEKDSNRIVLLKSRYKEAELEAKRLEAEEVELYATYEPKGPNALVENITLSDNHTYDVPEQIVIDNFTTRGPKATGGYRRATDINKDIRQDLAEAQEKGYIPNNLTYNVSKESGSWSENITVTVKGLSNGALYEDGKRSGASTSGHRELSKRLEKIVKAYGHFHSNAQIDSFNYSYYTTVNFEDETSRQARLKTASVAKQKLAGAKVRKAVRDSFLASPNSESFKKTNNINLFKSTPDGTSYGKIPGTNLVAVEYDSRIDGTRRLTVYDTTGIDNFEDKLQEPLKAATFLRTINKKDRLLTI